MASESKIDIEALLKPVSDKQPSGQDARDGKTYDILKEARREEDAEDLGEWKREAKAADWPKVVQTATKILTKESKDLQVAAWLLEALVKRHGFGGLRDGLKVIRGLHEQFWDSMYPAIEDGDLEYRSGSLEALNKVLPFAIRGVPLTHSPGGGRYAYWQYKESQEVENLRRAGASDAEKRRQLTEALEDGKLEGEKFERAVASTPLAHCSALLEDLGQSWEEFESLDRVLGEKYGEDAPSLRVVKESIEECRSLMNTIVKKKGGVGLQGSAEAEAAAEEGEAAPISSPGFSGGVVPGDRAEALRRLQGVAEFFRRTEPHSPVSYLVQRAARWGEMPLNEWLQEVIKSDDVLGQVRETLGIKEGSEPDQMSEG